VALTGLQIVIDEPELEEKCQIEEKKQLDEERIQNFKNRMSQVRQSNPFRLGMESAIFK
jgi:hypothetical protein